MSLSMPKATYKLPQVRNSTRRHRDRHPSDTRHQTRGIRLWGRAADAASGPAVLARMGRTAMRTVHAYSTAWAAGIATSLPRAHHTPGLHPMPRGCVPRFVPV